MYEETRTDIYHNSMCEEKSETMAEKQVLFEKKGAVGIITLNRPGQKNAVTPEMAADFSAILSGIRWDSQIRVFLIMGKNPDFCMGTDPKAYGQFAHREDRITYLSLTPSIATLPQPTIAVIQGQARGQGMELAMACDLRVASDDARFSMTHIDSDEMPFDGGTQRLPRLVGRTKAMELILTGHTLDARTAGRLGLVNRIVPSDELVPSAMKMAEDLSSKGPIALRYAKEAVMKGLDMTLEQGLRLEADLYYLLHTTHDRREGIKAFREKRTPEFSGK